MDQQNRILAVDDDPMNLAILEDLLEDYTVITATHGQEALEIAHQKRPDLILLDIMMPGMNGYEVCRALRQDKALCGVKIILVSAKARVEERLQGYEAGADDYVVKPFDCTELLAKIQVYLRLKSMEEIDQLKGSMLKLIGHELRTPLTGMISGLEILAEECPTEPEERRDIANLVLRNIHRLHNLIERAMLLCRLEAGEQCFIPNQVRADELVRVALVNKAQQATDHQITLSPVYHTQALLKVDNLAIIPVLSDVLDNAIRFSPNGSTVEILVQEDDQQVQFVISDQGKGITSDQQTHLFTGFTDSDMDHHSQGQGLSLAIAHRTVTQHGGQISIHSEPDQGTRVEIALPTADHSPLPSQPEVSLCSSGSIPS